MHYYTRLLVLIAALLTAGSASAQDFKQYFADSTLRLDYILAGTQSETKVTPEEAHRMGGAPSSPRQPGPAGQRPPLGAG